MSTVSPVRRGIVFPQGDVPGDPDEVRRFVTHVEGLGFDHLVVPDHVLGVAPDLHPGWSGVYDIDDPFHEPMVLFGFLSAVSTLELVTGIVVLPQRQAVLVAKQAAEIDLLSRGRLRLGVGIGWNRPEHSGMGMDFRTRGRRIEEQVAVMRRLWTEPCVTFEGSEHVLDGVGIAPLPPQRPIPVWIGAETATRAFERVGRIGDGWMAMGPPDEANRQALLVIRQAARDAGRDPGAIGVQAWVNHREGEHQRVQQEIAGWTELGATHIGMNTRSAGVQGLAAHLRLAESAMAVVDGVLR